MLQEYVASLTAQINDADNDDDLGSLPDPTQFLAGPPDTHGGVAAAGAAGAAVAIAV